jgi:hypothetical protein
LVERNKCSHDISLFIKIAPSEQGAQKVNITPAHPKGAKTRSFPMGYVEDFLEARTLPGQGAVSAATGQGGCDSGFFNILCQFSRRSLALR